MHASYVQIYHVSGNYRNNIEDGKWKYKYKAENGGIVHEHSSVVINYVDGNMEGVLKDVSAGELFRIKTTEYRTGKEIQEIGR